MFYKEFGWDETTGAPTAATASAFSAGLHGNPPCARMKDSEEYADIGVVTASNGGKGFYSSQVISKQYAQALIEFAEVGQRANPLGGHNAGVVKVKVLLPLDKGDGGKGGVRLRGGQVISKQYAQALIEFAEVGQRANP